MLLLRVRYLTNMLHTRVYNIIVIDSLNSFKLIHPHCPALTHLRTKWPAFHVVKPCPVCLYFNLTISLKIMVFT